VDPKIENPRFLIMIYLNKDIPRGFFDVAIQGHPLVFSNYILYLGNLQLMHHINSNIVIYNIFIKINILIIQSMKH
jgi:hypothetical protein